MSGPGSDAAARGGGGSPARIFPETALGGADFMVAHDGTRLMGRLRPAQAGKASYQTPGGVDETLPGYDRNPGVVSVKPRQGIGGDNASDKEDCFVLQAAFGAV